MTLQSQLVRLVAAGALMLASVSAQNPDVASLRHRAEGGDPIAQFDLAKAYMAGEAVTKDPKQALAWLRKSALQDYVGAQYALGRIYQQGVEIQEDQHEAANWFRKAARQQNKAAQDRLSEMLAQGLISKKEADWHASAVPKPKTDQSAPFSLAEVETGLSGGITNKRMATLVTTFGVDFKLGAGTRKRLADEGADDNLLATIVASKRSGQ